ncbi:N-acyl-D-amino-acid deacylase family protein [Plantactinospora mayteni]|uniref:N-acyl-D-amino-acid deacylase family protein n=1 Tax=Plantactinospora mayteni TaxID=566021 RepID=UPI0019451D75|nr:amidohydrolase family protein [Plantactinospora mayteni]
MTTAPGRLSGRRVLDATGRLVVPGFFDIHSHADLSLVLDPRAHSALLQGVTSVVTGNCGYGAVPPGGGQVELAANAPGGRVSDPGVPAWHSFPEYLEVLASGGTGINVFPLVSHAMLRLAVAGFAPRPVTDAELAEMTAMLRDAMQAGAAGFSTGLEYAPGCYATARELGALGKEAGQYDGLYATHCRNRTEHVEGAVREATSVALAGGCRLQLSHFVPRPAWPHRDAHERALEHCRRAPVPVRFDVFPFSHGPTPLANVLPGWVRGDGPVAAGRRLADPRLRKEIVAQLDPRFVELVHSRHAAQTYVVCDGRDGTSVGRTLADLGRDSDGLTAALDLLGAAGPDHREVTVLEPWATADELDRALLAEDYYLMGDGITAGLDGPVAGRIFSLSDWGWAPAVLSRFVRDRNLLSLPDAIHRMTRAPARQAGVRDRGSIEVGAKADLVVLDLAAIEANFDPAHPGRQPSGIGEVLVNGTVVVAEGRPTGNLAGQVGLAR